MERWFLLFYLCISLLGLACTNHGSSDDHREHIDQMFEKTGDKVEESMRPVDETIQRNLDEIDKSMDDANK